jgi:hypothetical protein
MQTEFEIIIKYPCSKCSFLEYKKFSNFSFQRVWTCLLFDRELITSSGMLCLNENDSNICTQCGECKLMIERFKKIPEQTEGE